MVLILELQKENAILKDEVKSMQNRISSLEEKVLDVENDKVDSYHFDDLERDNTKVQQFIMRNNLEIVNIPESIFNSDLENKVIKSCKAVDIDISKAETEAYHRLINIQKVRPQEMSLSGLLIAIKVQKFIKKIKTVF